MDVKIFPKKLNFFLAIYWGYAKIALLLNSEKRFSQLIAS
ncbi:hypothetical protein HMP0721_1128 [Pseudoramibacter alactolyticus ATCC 23263]|uniref:Uncharacterized protein n=1 Tax=Pseudoramibacter alactolyticus ATCC 23263 TaxID=887929 RepID=E6MGJ5_9FIRM|nr:hypothetical protein HMP0721_1128 [Pseudoramibacter alactolyticus ATCC 23263]